jgi:hypothetical protein
MEADPTLTQVKVAELIGHKPPWVSRLLNWYRAGCPSEGVFAGEAASRRAKTKDEVSSSKSCSLDFGPDRPFLPGVEGGPTDAPPHSETEATRLALGVFAACETFDKAVVRITADMMLRVHRSDGPKHRATLKKLEARLAGSSKANSRARGEVQAALKTVPQLLEAAE